MGVIQVCSCLMFDVASTCEVGNVGQVRDKPDGRIKSTLWLPRVRATVTRSL